MILNVRIVTAYIMRMRIGFSVTYVISGMIKEHLYQALTEILESPQLDYHIIGSSHFS
jgi:hypothetical protein